MGNEPTGNTPGKDPLKKQTTPVLFPDPKAPARPPAPPGGQVPKTIKLTAPATPMQLKKATVPISLGLAAATAKPPDAKRATSPLAAPPLPQTIQLKRPPTSPISVKPQDLTTAPTQFKKSTAPLTTAPTATREPGKSETSRIVLGAPTEARSLADKKPAAEPIRVATPLIPKTIQLKRPATPPVLIRPQDRSSAPTVIKGKKTTDIISEAPTIIKEGVAPPAVKSDTARLMVEGSDIQTAPTEVKRSTAPISIPTAPEAVPTPQTIHLKRSLTITSADETAGEALEAPSSAREKARKSETAKIELPAELVTPTPTSQRKTIKIKRTEREIEPRTVTLTRPGTPPGATPPAAEEAAGPVQEAVQKEGVEALFSIAALVAVLLAAGLVYLLAAQAFGPTLILPVPAQLL